MTRLALFESYNKVYTQFTPKANGGTYRIQFSFDGRSIERYLYKNVSYSTEKYPVYWYRLIFQPQTFPFYNSASHGMAIGRFSKSRSGSALMLTYQKAAYHMEAHMDRLLEHKTRKGVLNINHFIYPIHIRDVVDWGVESVSRLLKKNFVLDTQSVKNILVKSIQNHIYRK